jgi:hypothetical protein
LCAPPRFNPNEETMGSTPYGNATLMNGPALSQHNEIDCAGGSRASVGGRV